MVQVILGFDTEDYISPYSDEAILRLSAIMNKRGIRGCFNFVAELARALQERKRTDIIDSLMNHEIDYHTFRHSWHPTVIEYSDTEDWYEGYARFVYEESHGIDIVKKVFNRDKLYAAVPPGNSIAAQVLYAYRDLGIDIFYGSLFEGTMGEGIWFCNTLNLEYNDYMDNILLTEGIEGIKKRLDGWSGMKRLILCCHPNIILYKEFVDAVNMKGSNRVNWGEWMIPEKRPVEVIERFYDDFDAMLGILQDSGNFEFITLGDILKQQEGKLSREISIEMLGGFLDRIKDNFLFVKHGGVSYSLADIFGAVVHFICNKPYNYKTENIKGPIFEPEGVAGQVTLDSERIRVAASRLSDTRVIPHKIPMGDINIGPRDFLEAAAGILKGLDKVVISPKPQLPDISGFYHMNDFVLRGTWLHPENFGDNWVTKRLKLQSWTLRSE